MSFCNFFNNWKLGVYWGALRPDMIGPGHQDEDRGSSYIENQSEHIEQGVLADRHHGIADNHQDEWEASCERLPAELLFEHGDEEGGYGKYIDQYANTKKQGVGHTCLKKKRRRVDRYRYDHRQEQRTCGCYEGVLAEFRWVDCLLKEPWGQKQEWWKEQGEVVKHWYRRRAENEDMGDWMIERQNFHISQAYHEEQERKHPRFGSDICTIEKAEQQGCSERHPEMNQGGKQVRTCCGPCL